MCDEKEVFKSIEEMCKCQTCREKTIFDELEEVNGKVSPELMKRIYGTIDELKERLRNLEAELYTCKEDIACLERANAVLSKLLGEVSYKHDFKAYVKGNY